VTRADPRLHPELAELVERVLPEEEFERRVLAPPTEDELAETAALVEWFTRRYPTVRERFAYVRRAWRQWARPVRVEVPTGGPAPGSVLPDQ
jgi:hypothetical protein